MDTTIDEVSIEIGANSQSASSGLDNLTNSINNLISSLNTGLKGLSNFNSSLSKIKNITSGMTFNTESFSKIQNSLSGINNIGKATNLSSVVKQLKEIPNITESLDEKTISNFTSRIKELTSALSPLATEMVKVSTAFSALPNNLNKVNTVLSKTKNTINNSNKQGSFIDNIFSGTSGGILKTGLLIAGIQRLGTTIGGFVNESNSYIENMNLFSVSMGEAADKAKEFIDQYTSVLGVDPSNMMRYMGMFNSLIEGFGLSSDAAYTMSKNLTQLSYDMSSFLNIPIEDAMQKLKSGISGEIEPMRAVGVALDQATLQETAYALGIDKKVSSMTRAQKTELLYYQIMTKTTKMQGDMARTLISPANALRILQQQFTQLARAIGNIFIPILMAIVPYVQVVVQWLTTLANTIANFFGFEIGDYSADFSEISSGLGDVSTGLEDVGDSAADTNKELDKMLGKFDELNVIDFGDTSSSGSGSGSGTTGTGGSLGIPLPDYDALTGALTKNLDEVERKLKNILPYIEAIGLGLLAWKISSSVLRFLDNLGLIKNLSSALRVAAGVSIAIAGAWLLYKGIKQTLDEGLTAESIIKILGGTLLIGAGAALAFKSSIPLKIALGITLAVVAGILEGNGLKKVLSGDLSANSILSLLAGGVGAGAAVFTMTGNIKLALAVTLAIEGFNLGTMLGQWLNNNFGDSYDWYLKKFNVNLEDGVDFSDILGMIGTMLGTIGDAILEGLQNLWNLIPEDIRNGITTAFRVALAFATLGISELIGLLVNNWDSIKKFFTEDIPNFFTKTIPEWWNNIGKSLQEVWNNIVNWWNNSTLVVWWRDDVTPWFTLEKWQNLFNNIKTSIQNKWQEVVNWWNNNALVVWWNNNVAPWFTLEKWKNLANSIKEGISSKWNEFTSWFSNNGLSKWWNDNVAPWFTWQKWWGLVQDAVNAIKSAFENLNIKIKLPHFSWSSTPASGWIADVLSALNLPTSLPKLNIEWYAEGGFPETGQLFVAREAGPELVGNIGNKAAVANNDQIVEGIAQAAYQGVSQAMRENKGNERQPVNVYIGNKKVYSGYGQYLNSQNNKYGTNTIKL